MLAWLKPEVLVAAVIGVLSVGGTLMLNWSNGQITTALHANDISELKQSLAEIKTSIGTLPVQSLRLDTLERWRQEAQGMFGALDGRLRVQEDTASRNSTEIANIKSASGSKMR